MLSGNLKDIIWHSFSKKLSVFDVNHKIKNLISFNNKLLVSKLVFIVQNYFYHEEMIH